MSISQRVGGGVERAGLLSGILMMSWGGVVGAVVVGGKFVGEGVGEGWMVGVMWEVGTKSDLKYVSSLNRLQ